MRYENWLVSADRPVQLQSTYNRKVPIEGLGCPHILSKSSAAYVIATWCKGKVLLYKVAVMHQTLLGSIFRPQQRSSRYRRYMYEKKSLSASQPLYAMGRAGSY